MKTTLIEHLNLRLHSEDKSIGLPKWFILSAGSILLVTGLAKIISALGSAKYLNLIDPIFGITFSHLLLLVGVIEVVISGFCLSLRRQSLSLFLLAWIALSFSIYRLGLLHLGWHRPCSCMGNLTDALHITPQAADIIMGILLSYLLIGSCMTILWLWLQKKSPAAPNQ